jgi:hypothetical protein
MATAVILVKPTTFGYNEEAAEDNEFMSPTPLTESFLLVAQREFENLSNALADDGIDAVLFDHGPDLALPDAVYPNNWFSTHRTQEGNPSPSSFNPQAKTSSSCTP